MSEALSAIEDIKAALNEYGSDIILNIVTKGVYDPVLGDTANVITPNNVKAIVDNYNRQEIQDPNIHIKDKKFTFYFSDPIGYEDEIVFQGQTYSIERVDKKIFQNEKLLYTIQGRV